MFAKLRSVLPISAGLLLIALVIWFGGPYVAFGPYVPLESERARLIAIGLVVLVWVGAVVWKRLQAARKSDQLVAAVVKQAEAEPRPSADVVQLRERFEEAVATLKQQRRSGHSLYELPWYVIIGAPGAGKTTALVNSGLHFPLEQRSGKGALRGVGGTRNCDWWFTDEAIFLDTAGRYTTQDSDAGADSAGWLEFLALLKKYRKRRPVNGIILAISAHDLIMQGSGAPEGHVDAARRRLIELNKELNIQLPVYVMVTKCDLIAGFTEYFDDLNQEGRQQIWGVTFPYEQTQKGEAAKAFPAEFDALVARLNERVFARVEEDRDTRRRTKAFGFPQQMASLRESLSDYVSQVFGSTRFDQQILLRGVYFTSGTQEGTPIDRLLGAIGRRFAVSDAVMPPGRGKAYFIERLLKDVLFAESGLAGVNRRFEFQMAAAQMAAYVAMVAIAVIGVIVWSISYSRNRDYIDAVAADVARLGEVPPISASGGSLDAALPRLDAVRAVVDSANRYRDNEPWAMRWGLFQGRPLGAAARDAYGRELNGALLSHVTARFRQRLIDYAPEPEKLYEYLKGYLMLGDPTHLDKEQLAFLADLEWQAAYASDPDRAQAVSTHFRALLDQDGALRAVPLDDAIVTQARNTLRQASLPGLVYRYVRIQYANDTQRALRLDLAAGLGAERVLRRRSRVNLSEPLPSLYTKPVFQEIVKNGTTQIVKQFASELWVWGDALPSVTASSTLSADFLNLYEQDYIAAWDRVLNDIESAPLSTLPATKEALAILSGPTSPLRGLLAVVDEHTYLVTPPDPAAAPAPGLLGRVGGIFNAGRQAMGLPATQPGAQVTAHFEAIHRLVTGDKGSAPIDGILDKLRQLQQRVQPIGDDVGATNPGDPQSIAAVGAAANDLRRDAAPLPAGIGAVLTQVADGTAAAVRGGVRNTLENRYREEVVRECNVVVGNRYPFVATSAADVPPADFGRLFGYGGVYDAFFRTELASLVDTSRTPWAWRSDSTGATVGGSVAMLRQFEAAQRIRETFFRSGSQDLELSFTVTPSELDSTASRVTLNIDGTQIDYLHAAPRPVPVTWPGPKPGQVVATFEERGGARPNISFEGPWAWFRFIDAARLTPEPETEVRYRLTFERGGHEATMIVEARSIRNPYSRRDLQQFRCG